MCFWSEHIVEIKEAKCSASLHFCYSVFRRIKFLWGYVCFCSSCPPCRMVKILWRFRIESPWLGIIELCVSCGLYVLGKPSMPFEVVLSAHCKQVSLDSNEFYRDAFQPAYAVWPILYGLLWAFLCCGRNLVIGGPRVVRCLLPCLSHSLLSSVLCTSHAFRVYFHSAPLRL